MVPRALGDTLGISSWTAAVEPVAERSNGAEANGGVLARIDFLGG
jgi:hypothetical protein